MIQEYSAYPDWKAPAEDSAFLLWPDPDQIVRETQENHQRLAQLPPPLDELRRRQRECLKLSDDRPAIATGHQTELFHPGVWAKLAMIDAAARRIDADCLFAAVDSDAPKHLQLRWPGKSFPITDDARLATAGWCGQLNSPSAEHLQILKSAYEDASAHWHFTPLLGEFFEDLSQQAAPTGTGLSAGLTAAMYRLDWSLGLRHQSILTSRLWTNEPYLAFACHILASAGNFAEIYNTALAEYRTAHNIDNPGRPMPDLHVDDASCEVPFWLDDLANNTRSRATVHGGDGQWRLESGKNSMAISASKDPIASATELKNFLAEHHLRLAPRALTLTMFLRLLVVDQFIHGIGGGRYEQVNDRVIHRFFGFEPPAFSVTTATLLFPAAVGRTRACLPCLAHEGHRLRHAVMGTGKMEMVREIQQLPRKSAQRQRIFSQMHDRLAATVQIHPSVSDWQRRMSQAVRQTADEQGMFDRELFYAIQPRERLNSLIEKYQSGFGAA
jgi:hypothetical protein